MINIKKLTIGVVLTLSIASGVAFATTTNISGGTWTYGVVDPGNGYYMGYSYYYHPTKAHTSSVSVSGTWYRSALTAKGLTSTINGPSTQSKDIGYDFNLE